MDKDISIIAQHEQEFAYIDSLIMARTNAAISKLNAEALQTYWEVGAYIYDGGQTSVIHGNHFAFT